MGIGLQEEIALQADAFVFGVDYDSNDIESTKEKISRVKSSVKELEKIAIELGVVDITSICNGHIPCILNQIDIAHRKKVDKILDEERKEQKKKTFIQRM